MLKKLLVTSLLLFLLAVPVIQAQDFSGRDDDSASAAKENFQNVAIDQDVTVKKFDDGRIGAVENPDKLSEAQIDKVLLQMKLTEDDIKSLTMDFKKQLVSRGGYKVEVTTETKKYFRGIDGQRFLVTDENQEEIQALKEKLKKNKGAVSSLGMGSISDGIFSGTAYVFYLGLTSNNTEYRYDYYTTYNWDGVPLAYYSDRVAQSWQYHTTSVAHNGAHNRKPFCQNTTLQQFPYGTSDFTLSVGGTSAKFDIYGSGCSQYGALHDEVRIPVSNNGTTGSFISGYAHPWIGGAVGVVLSYLSIDYDSFTGDEWFWTNTFTIGS